MRRLSLTSTLFGVDPSLVLTRLAKNKEPQVVELTALQMVGDVGLEPATFCV